MTKEFVSGVVTGLSTWAFVHEPGKAGDAKYKKPPSYRIEVRNPEVVPAVGSVFKTNDDLRKYGIKVKAYQHSEDSPYAEMDGQRFIRFESKAGTKEDWPNVDPDLAAKRKPRVIDSAGNPIPEDVVIGNGSRVRVKFSVSKTPPSEGNPAAPFLDSVQVLELVTYDRPAMTGIRGLEVVEGGFVLGSEDKVTRIEAPSKAANTSDINGDEAVDVADLERLSDLEPKAKTQKRKAA